MSNSNERIMATISQEMQRHASRATLTNLDDVELALTQLLDMAHFLAALDKEQRPSTPQTVSDRTIAPIEKQPETTKDKPVLPPHVGVFEQRVVHGSVKTANGKTLFIPESVIRKLDLQHGQWVKCTPNGRMTQANEPLYDYTLADEQPDELPESNILIDHKYPIEARQTADGLEYFVSLDQDTEYIVSEREMEKQNLEDGDIVDISWVAGRFEETARIAWKHHD